MNLWKKIKVKSINDWHKGIDSIFFYNIIVRLKNMLLITFVFFVGTFQLVAQSQQKKPLDAKSAFVAVLISYSDVDKKNSKSLIENVVSSNVTTLSVRSFGGYFLKQNFALGLGFDYTSEQEESENINTFGPNSFVDRDFQTFTFTPFIRNYFPIGVNNRFYLFTQTGLELGFGNGDESNNTGDTNTSATIDRLNYGIAFTPGLIFLVQKGFAFEINVGVLGLNHSKETTTPTNDEESVVKRTNFNFDINLLKLNLGISYYF